MRANLQLYYIIYYYISIMQVSAITQTSNIIINKTLHIELMGEKKRDIILIEIL